MGVVGCLGGWVAGFLKMKLMLTQLSTKLELKLKGVNVPEHLKEITSLELNV